MTTLLGILLLVAAIGATAALVNWLHDGSLMGSFVTLLGIDLVFSLLGQLTRDLIE